MYTIVAGVDQNQERTTALARAIKGLPIDIDRLSVVLIHSFNENRSGASVAQVSAIQRAQEVLEESGIDVILEESGNDDPSEAVRQIADEYDADLIAVAGRKRSPTRKALFGSVSQELMLDSELPVLVCSPE